MINANRCVREDHKGKTLFAVHHEESEGVFGEGLWLFNTLDEADAFVRAEISDIVREEEETYQKRLKNRKSSDRADFLKYEKGPKECRAQILSLLEAGKDTEEIRELAFEAGNHWHVAEVPVLS